MTPEEKAVIDAAMREHRGCAPESCGGSGLDPCRLGSAIETLRMVEESYRTEVLKREWVPTTLLYALAGDRLRIGQDETDVLRSSSGAWHANVVSSVLPSGKVWDKIHPWEHRELRLELSANPGFRQYPEDLACEILMSAERRAVHLLMTSFPGSTVLDSPQAEK